MSQTCTPPGKCRDFLEVRVSLVLREAVSSLARAPAAETKAGAPFLRMPSWPPSLAVALAAAGAVSGAAGCSSLAPDGLSCLLQPGALSAAACLHSFPEAKEHV